MRKRHGWTADSKMPARYVHLVDSDVESAIFEHYGIVKKEDTKPDMPIKCQFCDMFNSHDSEVCSKCAKPLDLEASLKIDEKNHQHILEQNKKIETLEKSLKSFEEKRKKRDDEWKRTIMKMVSEYRTNKEKRQSVREHQL